MRLTMIVYTSLLMAMEGCVLADRDDGDLAPPGYERSSTQSIDYQLYFDAFDNPWVGRSREELIAEFGAPDAIFEARPLGTEFEAGIRALSYVYGIGSTSHASCVDVYVVAQATDIIIKYYCR